MRIFFHSLGFIFLFLWSKLLNILWKTLRRSDYSNGNRKLHFLEPFIKIDVPRSMVTWLEILNHNKPTYSKGTPPGNTTSWWSWAAINDVFTGKDNFCQQDIKCSPPWTTKYPRLWSFVLLKCSRSDSCSTRRNHWYVLYLWDERWIGDWWGNILDPIFLYRESYNPF